MGTYQQIGLGQTESPSTWTYIIAGGIFLAAILFMFPVNEPEEDTYVVHRKGRKPHVVRLRK